MQYYCVCTCCTSLDLQHGFSSMYAPTEHPSLAWGGVNAAKALTEHTTGCQQVKGMSVQQVQVVLDAQ
jgi:hypothetical protein